MTARTRISHGHDHTSRQFLFDVEVELLHPALLEIKILRLNGSRESSRVGLLGKNGESVGHVQAKVERPNASAAHAAVGAAQPPTVKANWPLSAKNGGFSHRPCAPWFQEESWNMA